MASLSRVEVWQTDFSGSRGHEQKKVRPCAIWKDLDHLGMAIVIPFTGSLERDNLPYTYFVEPSSANGLEKESIALVFQITAIDKKRLIKRLGELNPEDISAIAVVMKDILRVNPL